MNWIDKLNKELQERRHVSKTSEAKEEAEQRRKCWAASLGGKVQGPINGIEGAKNGQHDIWRKSGQSAIKENYDEWVEKVTQGGITAKEKGIIQETQHRSSQTEHECSSCGKKGKGNLFKGLHFDNCGKEKTFPQRYIFRMYKDEVLVEEFPKLKDIAESFGCSISHMSGMISGNKKTPTGFKFEKVDLHQK